VHWDEGTPVLAVNTQVQQWIQAALDMYTNGALGQGRNDFLKSLPRVAPQGTKFSYNSGNTQVLAWLTEKLYGKPFNQVISEKLWAPTGMAGDARILTDRVGDAIASQGLYARIFDLGRFGELYRNGGRTPDGRQIVSSRWVRSSTTMTAISEGEYAHQWWAGPTTGSYTASGFQGQKITVSPQHCLTGVRLAHTLGGNFSSGSFEVEMGEAEWGALYRAIAARLGGCGAGAGAARSRGARGRAVRLGGPRRLARRAALRRGALRIVVGVGRRTPVRLSVTSAGRRPVRIASRRVTLRAGRPRAVSVPLTRAGRRMLRARRSVRVVVRALAGGARAQRAAVVR
jgi:CubicO group peptidase (beta-lactamase class C family)